MNSIPKLNHLVVITSQVMRMRHVGSRAGAAGSGGSFGDPEQGPADPNKTSDYCKGDANTQRDATTLENPKNPSPMNEPPTVRVPTENDPLYMMAHKKPNEPRGRVNQDIIEHLKSYFDDQIMYYKTMANYNKSAMKRIKKIKKNWSKMLD